jgi:hypothetical protein
MPILRKREKRKKQRTDVSPNGKVYMPRTKNAKPIVKRKKKKEIFRKPQDNKTLRRRKSKKFNPSFLFFYFILPLILISLLYASTLFVIRMRGGSEESDVEKEYVIGLDDIPTYPGSQFIFTNNIKEMSVANFIGTGNSAYRLPMNSSVTDAYTYYNTILPELGWEYVLSVEIASEEMKHGEYWVKGNTGLRIYSKFNDVWYETITKDQAITGLRERVEKEIERDLLLASQEYQELLPDFPWIIKVPKEYIISYRASGYESLRIVEFRKIGSSETIRVTPINKIGLVLDNYLREYIEDISTEEDTWTIINTVLSSTTYAGALRGTISNNLQTNNVAVVQNTYNGIVYVIDSNTLDDPFFDYVLSNLEPANMLGD